MTTKKDLNTAVTVIEEILRKLALKENRHEEFYNGVAHTIVAIREVIRQSDLEEGE